MAPRQNLQSPNTPYTNKLTPTFQLLRVTNYMIKRTQNRVLGGVQKKGREECAVKKCAERKLEGNQYKKTIANLQCLHLDRVVEQPLPILHLSLLEGHQGIFHQLPLQVHLVLCLAGKYGRWSAVCKETKLLFMFWHSMQGNQNYYEPDQRTIKCRGENNKMYIS